jgi:UDP-N-acetylmuramoyl-tripeptide--D-alanyl-D-alanine ligase
LRGENFDGHRFVAHAVAAGAAGVLVSEAVAVPDSITVFKVADTLLALQLLGSAARRSFSGPLVAITGSNGKTTTRQLVASMLRAHFGDDAVLATEGNLNNHIGVPLTLLRLTQQHQAAVVEMGMNHFHELSLLSALARPTISVITNAGPAHLQGVGSIAGVAHAKSEIFDGMTGTGIAVVNGDDYFLPYWEVVNRSQQTVRFGFGGRADVRGTYDATSSTVTVISGLAEPLSVQPPFAGGHNASNTLAAVAVGRCLGVSATAMKRGLEAATNIGGRLTRRQISATLCIIDDSYNANPASVRAGLEVLSGEPGRTVIVLGDMAELGGDSDVLHAELLRDIEQSSVDRIVTLGNRMHAAARSTAGRTQAFLDIESLVAFLASDLAAPSTLLVKGAHSMAMHRVIDRLAAMFGNGK